MNLDIDYVNFNEEKERPESVNSKEKKERPDPKKELMRCRIDDLFYSHHSLLPNFTGRAYFTYIYRAVSYLFIAIYMDWTIIIRHPLNFILLIAYFSFVMVLLFPFGIYLLTQQKKPKSAVILKWGKTKNKVLEEDLKNLKKDQKDLKKDLKKVKEDLKEDLEKELKDKEKELKDSEKELKDSEKELKDLEKELKDKEKELKDSEKELKDLEKDSKVLVKDSDDLEKDSKVLEKALRKDLKGMELLGKEENPLKPLDDDQTLIKESLEKRIENLENLNKISLEERVKKFEPLENLENHGAKEVKEVKELENMIENLEEKNNNLYKLLTLKSLLYFSSLVYNRKDYVTSKIHSHIKYLKCNLNGDNNDNKDKDCYDKVYKLLCELPVAPGAPEAPKNPDKSDPFKNIEDRIKYLLSNNVDEKDIKKELKYLDHEIEFTSISELNTDNGGSYCGMFWSENKNFIVVSFKGTSPDNFLEWLNNVTFQCVDARNYLFGQVHRGFYNYLFPVDEEKAGKDYPCQNIIEQINCKAEELHKENGEKVKLWITGHSLGGALATLFYARLLKINLNENKDWKLQGAVTFASPAVGDNHFAAELAALINDPRNETSPLLRIVVNDDAVPKLPYRACSKNMRKYGYSYNVLMNYSQVGDKIEFYNCKKDPSSIKQFFRSTTDDQSTRDACSVDYSRKSYCENYHQHSTLRKFKRLSKYIRLHNIFRIINSHNAVDGYFKVFVEYEERMKGRRWKKKEMEKKEKKEKDEEI